MVGAKLDVTLCYHSYLSVSRQILVGRDGV